MEFNRLIPELSVSNINTSKEFYTKLGFRIVYERPENNFAFIELDGCQIMLDQVNATGTQVLWKSPLAAG